MRFASLIFFAFVAVDPWGWDRFGPLRFAVLSALGFGIVAATLRERDERRLPFWFVAGWTALLVTLATSAAFSADRWHGLVGTPDRHFGWLTWTLCGLLALVASGRARSIRAPVVWSLAAGVAVAGLWTVAERAGVDAVATGFADGRAGGPFGQPAYLGAAAALALPAAVGVVLHAERRTTALAGAVAALLGLGALVGSGSRGAMVGVFVAAVIAGAARIRPSTPRRPVIFLGLTGLASLALAGPRLATLLDANGVVAGRIDEWQVGLRAMSGAPALGLVGWGPESYRIVFGEFVDDQYVIDHGRRAITDRSHNGLLDVALAGGWIAAAAYAALSLGAGWVAWRCLRTGDAIDVGLGVGVIAYLVQQQFLFPLAEVDPILWIVVGVLIGRHPPEVPVTPLGGRAGTALAVMAGTTALIAAVAGIADVAADRQIASAINRDEPASSERGDRARSLRPDSIRYHFVAARLSASNGVDAQLERVTDGLARSGSDPALRAEEARLLLDRARETDDPQDLDVATTALVERARVDPRHPETLMQLGIALALDGQLDDARIQLQRAVALAPGEREPRQNLAEVERLLGLDG